MEIDNFDLILPLLTYESDDDFYYLQILQRKKENDEIGSNSRVVRNYYIKSNEYLYQRKSEIIKLCQVFNARAMIRLNKRSFEKTSFKAIQNLANTMSNKEFSFCMKSYDRACGQGHNATDKTWIVDIDFQGRLVNDILLFIERQCDPIGKKFVAIIPSKSGSHLITKPFNVMTFKNMYHDIEVHKDNPTNLFIP